MKKIGLVVWAMVMISCEAMLGFDDYVIPEREIREGNSGEYVVSDYNLRNYVPAPVAGEMAVRDVVRGDVAVSVEWQDKEGAASETREGFTFVQGVDYRARITLTAQSPYVFANIPFAYPDGTVAEQDAADMDVYARTVAVVYKRTTAPEVIGDEAVLDLASYLPAPRAGSTPVRSFAADSFAGLVEWAPGDALFQANTAYTATASLYTATGYTFAGAAGFRYGAKALTPIFQTDRMVVVEMRFSETGSVSSGSGDDPGVIVVNTGSGDSPGVIIEW